jgi:prepilin-type N-terminal cleavage/methylation domain-containing protein
MDVHPNGASDVSGGRRPTGLHKPRAFTLVELLIVIAAISVLMAISLPCFRLAREQARLVRCMANLRDIGHQIYLYSQDYQDRLVPGDWAISWHAWGPTVEYPPGIPRPDDAVYQRVNLGHLLRSRDLPSDRNHVFFCPSAKGPDGEDPYAVFKRGWGVEGGYAPISYMYNHTLDGFYNNVVEPGYNAVEPHRDKINFLRGDGSVDRFHDKRLVYDDADGPQLMSEACAAYGGCFPQVLLHQWLEQGSVNLAEAQDFLHADEWVYDRPVVFKPIKLSQVSRQSVVCDMVGAWGGGADLPKPDT